MQVDVPSNPDVVAHDQPSAPGKERERDPILGGQVSNITNGINGTSWDFHAETGRGLMMRRCARLDGRERFRKGRPRSNGR